MKQLFKKLSKISTVFLILLLLDLQSSSRPKRKKKDIEKICSEWVVERITREPIKDTLSQNFSKRWNNFTMSKQDSIEMITNTMKSFIETFLFLKYDSNFNHKYLDFLIYIDYKIDKDEYYKLTAKRDSIWLEKRRKK
jgi:hypothetical protein